MADDIPTWAKDRALELAGTAEYAMSIINYTQLGRAFAAYIAAHEEPPVDPLLIEAREIAAKFYIECGGGFEPNGSADAIRRGQGDNTIAFQCALAALKRGIELGRETV